MGRMNMSPKTKLLFGFGFLVFVISVALMIIGAGNIDLAHSTQLTERACVNINGVKYCSMLTPLWSTCHVEPMIPIHMLSSGLLYIVIILTIMSIQILDIQKPTKIKVGLLAVFGIWLCFGSYWTFGTLSRVDYNNDLRNGAEKLICSYRLSRARLGDEKVDSILASVPNDGQFNCIKTWRLSDSLDSESKYCPQYLYLFSFSTIMFGWLIFIASVFYLKVASSSSRNDIIEIDGQIV